MNNASSVAKENLSPAIGSIRAPRLAFAALLAGNVTLAFGALLVRYADTGPVVTAFWRLAIAAPLLFLLARRAGQQVGGLPRATLLLVLLGGLFFAADTAIWNVGILKTKLANATLFGNCTSLLLVVYGLVLARQRPQRQTMIAVVLAFAGALILMSQSYEASREYLIGDLLSLLAGLLYTVYVLLLQKVRGTMGSWSVLALSTLAGAALLLLVVIARGEPLMPGDWTPLIALALSSQILGQGLLIYALPHFSALIIGLVLLVQPAIAAMVGWLVFGETIGPVDFVGAALVGLALVLVRAPEKT